jgi:hypothetical protein
VNTNFDIKVQDIFEEVSEYCEAIYKGGSRLDPVIDNPHDYDYICFAKDLQRHFLRAKLLELGVNVTRSKLDKLPKETQEKYITDFSQIRVPPYTQIT